MEIVKIYFKSEFFNIKDTLECGQLFRFLPHENGYLVFSLDKCCLCYSEDDSTIVECLKDDEKYFYSYFDLERSYEEIYKGAMSHNIDVLSLSAKHGKGIRILNQNPLETLFSFIISQNNNIPRIKGIIDKLCKALGEKRTQFNYTYYSFPSAKVMAQQNLEFYKSIGLGYRADYVRKLAIQIHQGLNIDMFAELTTQNLKKQLVSIHGVGPKVADCVALFGFHRCDSFPVDTWIEKVYKDNFFGKLNDRDKITDYFVGLFGDNSGYYQQYLFYYKRSLEEKRK